MLDDSPHPDQDQPRPVGIDAEEVRRRLEDLPLRAVAAFAARWGLRLERFLDRLSDQDQTSAARLVRVGVTVASGGEVAERREAERAAFRLELIAARCAVLAAWHRVGMRWALVRDDASRFAAAMAAADEATARCNVAGAVARLGQAALAAEAFVAAADHADDFEEALAETRDRLIASALTAAAAVASWIGAPRCAAAAEADLDRITAGTAKPADWLGFPLKYEAILLQDEELSLD